MILIFHFQAVGDDIEYMEQRSINNSLSHLFGMISSTFLLQQFFLPILWKYNTEDFKF
jgi:hypothetical protein